MKAHFGPLAEPIQRFFITRPRLRKILVNIFWLSADRVIFTVLSIVVGALVARHLGPANWGDLTYAGSIIEIAMVVTGLGLNDIVVAQLVRQDKTAEEILGSAFLLRFVSATLTFALTLVVLWHLPASSTQRVLVVILGGGLLLQPFFMPQLWFQSQIESKYVVWISNSALIITNLLKILFILGGLSVTAFAWSHLLWQMMTVAGLLFITGRYAPLIRTWHLKWSVARSLLHDSWPLVVAGLATSITLRMDQIMLGTLVNSDAVGIYAAARRFSDTWYFVPIAIAASLFPSIVQSYTRRDKAGYTRRIQAFFDVFAGLGYAIILLVNVFGPILVDLLFGQSYHASIQVLHIHIWTVLFISLHVARDRVLLAANKTPAIMFLTGSGAVVSILLNLWLIPRYGASGSAAASVIAFAVAGYLGCLFFKDLRLIFKQLTLAILLPFRLPSALRTLREIL